MKTKKVYTVFGSEDGILGVYTSMTKALIRAKGYVLGNGGKARIKIVCDSIRYVENTIDRVHAKIEAMTLNGGFND